MSNTVSVDTLRVGTCFTVMGSDNVYRSTDPVYNSTDAVLADLICRHTADAQEHISLPKTTMVAVVSEEDHNQHQDWIAREEERLKRDKLANWIFGGAGIILWAILSLGMLNQLEGIMFIIFAVLNIAGMTAIAHVVLYKNRAKFRR